MAESVLPTINEGFEDEVALRVEQRAAERRRRFTATLDTYLLLVTGTLIAIGLMMVWSTTFYWSDPQSALFMQQARNAGIGIVIMFVIAAIDYRFWRRLAIPLMGVMMLLLLGLVVLPSVQLRYGARRAYFNGAVQPSEVAVLCVVIYMAVWLSSKQTKIRYLTYGLLPFLLLVGSVAGLIILEPDLSTAALVFMTAALMFFLAGADWVQIILTVVAFAFVGVVAVSRLNYAQDRVKSYVEILRDPLKANDQAKQAIIGFLRGGIGGVGLGQSYQKFAALPAPHTDSILAVLGEELGLAGCAVVIALYIMLMLRGFRIARNAPDNFGALLATGMTLSIVLEALLNIAVMSSVVPFTGVPLPFISFGGSSLVASLAAVGVLLSVSRATAKNSVPKRRVNETLSLPGMRGILSRVRHQIE